MTTLFMVLWTVIVGAVVYKVSEMQINILRKEVKQLREAYIESGLMETTHERNLDN